MKSRASKFLHQTPVHLAIAWALTGAMVSVADAQPRRAMNQAMEDRGMHPNPGRPLRDELRGQPPGEGPAMDWERIAESERQQLRSFIQQHFPALWLELSEAQEKDPARFLRQIRRIGPSMYRLMRITRSDPELGALAVRERQLDLEIRRTVADARSRQATGDRAELRRRLTQLQEQMFDVQQSRRRMEIMRIEARLSELKGRMAENEQLRERLIRSRVEDSLEGRAPGGPGRPGERRGEPPIDPAEGDNDTP